MKESVSPIDIRVIIQSRTLKPPCFAQPSLCVGGNGVRARITKLFREACPSGLIIAITDQYLQCPPQDADSFLYGVEGPEALIEAVRGTSESSDTSAA
jgi:hypothetical protein